MTDDRAVLTLATGKPYYTWLAVNLARSFLICNEGGGIRFVLATNHPERVPRDVAEAVEIRVLPDGELPGGFSAKLHLDELAPAKRTLFIDADCLVAGPLGPVFERFAGRAVSVVGRMISEGENFGDVAFRCRAVGVGAVPLLCGGLYYLEPGPACRAVYQTARDLKGRYAELGMTPLRNVENEEPLMGLAMAIHGQAPVPEDGTIKADAMFFSRLPEVDVFGGRAMVRNHPRRPKLYPFWQVPEVARPVVVHFNASFAQHPPYTSEAARMAMVRAKGWPLMMATAVGWAGIVLPFRAKEGIKAIFRPAYHWIFGPRKVKASPRV